MTCPAHNRGGVYLLVLVTSSVAMSIGMLAVTAMAAQREMQELAFERNHAARRAESGIHLALQSIADDDTWRTRGGHLLGPTTLERGQLWVDGSDDDGSLTDGEEDPFTLTSSATFGRAKQRVAADLEAVYTPVEALQYAIVAQGGMTSLGSLSLTFGAESLDLSLVLLNSLNPWGGDKSMDQIALPPPSIIDTYAARGTAVPASLSVDGGGIHYEDLVLTASDAQSKEGRAAADANSIYVIDGRGGPVRLADPRIVGTLVVINASSLEMTIVRTLRPAGEGLPVLLTDAPLTIDGARSSDTDTAIPDTDDDTDGPDFDPEAFDGVQGIIFANSDVSLFNGFDLHGTLMTTGTLTASGETNVTRNDAFLEAPPPGVRAGRSWKIVAGSWRAVVD